MPEVTDVPPTAADSRPSPLSTLRRQVYGLRTEGTGPARETAAIACGVFIGCLPFYGFHLLICLLVGWAFRLNRLKLYLAANISNPFVAPFLLFAELQTGSYLRRGAFHPLTLDAIRQTGAVALGVDLLLGSVVVGSILAALAALGTYATIGGRRRDDAFVDLVRRASDRYVNMSITAWEFARGKLRNDPVYRAAVYEGLLLSRPARRSAWREGGRLSEGGLTPRQAGVTADASPVLLDIGCGQGLMLALLAEARRDVRAGSWVGAPPPVFETMIGIETRPRVAAFARAALQDEAEVVTLDAREGELPPADVILLFDVLHLMNAADQEQLLRAVKAALRPGGAIVIREADAGAGWKFGVVRAGNRLKALAVGEWAQTFHFRSASEWMAVFDRLGLSADVRQMGQGTPFGNVLFRVEEFAGKSPTQGSQRGREPLGSRRKGLAPRASNEI
jgi:uncharacterized protein (DUF2062 family)/SAM-dependent methyltransferase